MPKGVYPRSEEHKRKIGQSRKRYFDEHGRVVEINQKESPEAYREYMKSYQKLWRASHSGYYKYFKQYRKDKKEGKFEGTFKEWQIKNGVKV